MTFCETDEPDSRLHTVSDPLTEYDNTHQSYVLFWLATDYYTQTDGR